MVMSLEYMDAYGMDPYAFSDGLSTSCISASVYIIRAKNNKTGLTDGMTLSYHLTTLYLPPSRISEDYLYPQSFYTTNLIRLSATFDPVNT